MSIFIYARTYSCMLPSVYHRMRLFTSRI